MDSRKWLMVALVLCGLASACSDYNTNLSIQTSSSLLTFISPSTATVGGPGFTITANGSGFTTGAEILWNGKALNTTLVNSSQLTAPVPASNVATAGTVQVAVQIPGSATSGTNINSTTTTEVSNIVIFTINAAPGTPPTITSLSTSTTPGASAPFCGSQSFTLTVTGTNFTSDAIVSWNGIAQATTFTSATQLNASIPPTLTAFPGPVVVTVSNSNGSSGSLPFTLSTPTTALASPSISSLSQTSAAAGSPALTLTVTGTNLLPCSVVEWVSPGNVTTKLTTTYVSATQLSATVLPADFLVTGSAQVMVLTQGPPGGGTSGGLPFTIVPPTITSLSSNTTPSCSATPFPLTVNGTNFVNGSVVDWNGSARATTFVNSTQLTALISAADLTSAATVSITVSNFGVSSASVPFTISAATLATPSITSISPAGATAGTAAFSVVFTGANFLPCSSVQLVDAGNVVTQLATTYVSSTQLSASLTAANIAAVKTVQLEVANPAASANTSNTISFPIVLPTIVSLSASTTALNSTPSCSPVGITLTVNGTNFVSNGLVVNWNGSPRPTTFVSATKLTAAISSTDTAFPGPVTVTVSSATVPSLASASSPFTIAPSTTPLPKPAITALLPSSSGSGSAAFLLGVDGSGAGGGTLAPCSVVQWNGSPRPTTFTSPAGLNAAISAADVASVGMIPVTVFTLTDGGGGGTSNSLTFTIHAPSVPAAVSVTSLARPAASVGSAAASESPSLVASTMSADKRFAVVVLASADGVTEIPGTSENIFVRDTCAGAPAGCAPSVTIASIGLNNNPADGDSISPAISADGRYVVFLSSAMNLVDSDTNGVTDVFVRDTCSGAPSGCTPSTRRVSVASDGTQANGASASASIGATGRYITFESAATNLAPASSSTSGLFLRDTCAGAGPACTPSTQTLDSLQ